MRDDAERSFHGPDGKLLDYRLIKVCPENHEILMIMKIQKRLKSVDEAIHVLIEQAYSKSDD